MALVKVKPTSPGRRGLVKVVNRDLHKGRPFAPLQVDPGEAGDVPEIARHEGQHAR